MLLLLFFRSKITWNFTFIQVNKILSTIFEKQLWKKSESLTQHFIFMSFNYYKIFWNYLCEIHVHRRIGHFVFCLTDVKLAYTSTHANKSFLSLVYVKSFESSQLFLKFCSKFWRDCYDSKTYATWRFTQRSMIYFKNLENFLFRVLGVIEKIC